MTNILIALNVCSKVEVQLYESLKLFRILFIDSDFTLRRDNLNWKHNNIYDSNADKLFGHFY